MLTLSVSGVFDGAVLDIEEILLVLEVGGLVGDHKLGKVHDEVDK